MCPTDAASSIAAFRILLLALAAALFVPSPVVAVQYRVRFDATWSSATHPGAYPSGAHFSPLVGATHNDQVTFWEPGGIASAGMEKMAETGGTSTLRSEFQAAAGDVHSIILGGGLNSPGSTTTTFDIMPGHSLVTLVTMVAPSPDWFVGVAKLDLRNGDAWVPEVAVDLFSYDSGTDSGIDFTSANADITPHIPITLLGAPLAGTPDLGTFTFTLLPVAGDMNGDGEIDFEDLSPFVLALTDPAAYDGQFPDLDRIDRCDLAGQGECNFASLSPFVDLLVGNPLAGPSNLPATVAVTIPEPTALVQAGICGLVFGCAFVGARSR